MMTTTSTLSWAGIASLAGVINHLAIFIHGNWDKHTSSIVRFYTAVEAVVLDLVSRLSTGGFFDGVFRLLVLDICYFLGLLVVSPSTVRSYTRCATSRDHH
ncbi:hypothetical protein BJX63DRAFT_383290 [Aspergillus granulosus]|uniref:Uncharacterized protein n=1 Tax=Aspergillus granulosus TaxID=176169 RepID=A0ABR4HTV2_9EURO